MERQDLSLSPSGTRGAGTGKHVLVPPYCVLEPMEATNGILVAGLNTALLFAILASIARRQAGDEDLVR